MLLLRDLLNIGRSFNNAYVKSCSHNHAADIIKEVLKFFKFGKPKNMRLIIMKAGIGSIEFYIEIYHKQTG